MLPGQSEINYCDHRVNISLPHCLEERNDPKVFEGDPVQKDFTIKICYPIVNSSAT